MKRLWQIGSDNKELFPIKQKAFLFPSRRNAFLYSVSLGVMIFFAAADPEGNCHEKCQQLGDGNRKPDAVRSQP